VQAHTPAWVIRFGYACSIAVLCAVLAACGGERVGGASTTTGGDASADGFPVTVQNCGRPLTFDQPPSRAVLPYHPMAEIFVGLGLADRAIGRVGWKGGLNKAPILPEQAADFERIPVVSDTFFPPPKEQMLSLRADFLLAYGDFDYGGKHQGAEGLATLEELNATGVQVYTVVCPDEAGDYTNENLDTLYRTILDLGKIFGVSDRAERRVAEMQAQIAEVSQKVRNEPVAKVLAYSGGQGPLSVNGGRATLITQIIEAAGGENVFADTNKYTVEASLETVASRQVDAFLIFADSEEPTNTPDGTKEAQFLFSTFPNMQASKDRRVIVTDYTFISPGWRTAQTVEDIARQLHPEVFK
jgi:iron complex transport system substrate-binding protein